MRHWSHFGLRYGNIKHNCMYLFAGGKNCRRFEEVIEERADPTTMALLSLSPIDELCKFEDVIEGDNRKSRAFHN